MKELYSIDEILNAVDELQVKKSQQSIIKKQTHIHNKKDDIPTNTLKLIEEAEKTINKS
ncbi:hypothetical protein OA383_01785 [Candidatus Pelagibacter bacterium]|nr:hypothetical protein [Candidatus Pelagibacter bacterium]